MGQVILEFSPVAIPVCVGVLPLTVEPVVYEASFVLVAVIVDQFSQAVGFPMRELPGINIALRRGEDSPAR